MAVLITKVLLVEDSKFLRMANERALFKAGYQVLTAADGEQALRVAIAKLPDIILLDLMLPKVSGQEVLKALKANPTTMHIPVIVLTSLSKKNEEKLLQDGAAAYFEKSSLQLDKSSDRLAGAVEAVLERLHREQNLDLGIREAAAKRAANVGSRTSNRPAENWEIEIAGVESTPCTTTIPRPPLKN